MDVYIERMNHTGDGIGYIDGKVVFVKKVVVGDVVRIKNLIEKKKYYTADVDFVVSKGDFRVDSECPCYFECGGCQLMNYDYDRQLDYKKGIVVDLFRKYGNIDINPSIVGGSQYFYRNKVVLQVDDGIKGLYKCGSNDIVELNSCMIVNKNINNVIRLLDNVRLIGVKKILIRGNKEILVNFEGDVDSKEVISCLGDYVNSIFIDGELVYGKEYIYDTIGEYKFKVSVSSFFQVNNEIVKKLYDKVLEYMGDNVLDVMDLYCGTGTIGIYVASKVRSVYGVEINKMAVSDANDNAKLNNIENISFRCGDVSKVIDSNKYYDAVIVDPPRAGLDKRTKSILLEIGSKRIIYVSCNPITLIRDINDLSCDYELRDISLFDMFPNTYHCESVVILERR